MISSLWLGELRKYFLKILEIFFWSKIFVVNIFVKLLISLTLFKMIYRSLQWIPERLFNFIKCFLFRFFAALLAFLFKILLNVLVLGTLNILNLLFSFIFIRWILSFIIDLWKEYFLIRSLLSDLLQFIFIQYLLYLFSYFIFWFFLLFLFTLSGFDFIFSFLNIFWIGWIKSKRVFTWILIFSNSVLFLFLRRQ